MAQSCTLFTNTDQMKKDDPYAILGISFGATTSDIKEAYKKQALILHPDINKEDKGLKKFQRLQEAYKKLMDVKGAPHRDDLMEEWSFAVWRNSDIIAQDRTDVAGLARKRPIKPAAAAKAWGVASIGHPDGGGNRVRREEYLGAGDSSSSPRRTSNSVGSGQNKWVRKKKFVPWKADETNDAIVNKTCNGKDGDKNC